MPRNACSAYLKRLDWVWTGMGGDAILQAIESGLPQNLMAGNSHAYWNVI
jgi:hypothetical protein